jgi:gliding motility-associated-like protein
MKNLIFLFALSFSSLAFGSHIIGGEVYYDSLGNDQYAVTFEMYRDCNGLGAAFDNPLGYTVFHDDGTIFQTFNVALFSSNVLPIVYDDPCVTPPNDICVERGIYHDTITLPATANGYYIVYQRCCWAANIQNIVDPVSWGITIRTDLPGTDLVGIEDNNSARFDNYPPLVLCSGNTLNFDHAATDIDGDSLVYFMCDPETVDGLTGPIYDPENPEPYATVTWDVGYSGIQPLGTGSTVTIDPVTGSMDLTPDQIGTFVAAVCVQEYRNGVLINQKSRTFGYRVVECDVLTPMTVDVISQGELIEGCSTAGFVVSRDDSTDAVTVGLSATGTATNGEDYNFLPDSLTLLPNVGTDTILITPYFDTLNNVLLEGDETITFSIIIEDPCNGTYDTTTAYLTVVDYIPMTVSIGDSLNLCDEFGDWGTLWCDVDFGVPPYQYYWAPTQYANNDTITFPATDLEPNLNLMSVQVFDACGRYVISEEEVVYNRCPVVAPNVITPNDDQTNDYFIVKNLEDYDRVHLMIFNRWGNQIYENEDYQNDWNGVTEGGTPLAEGVYFYVVQPESDKYEYDDAQKTIFTLHGFFHIMR